jgi:hypothetical protein
VVTENQEIIFEESTQANDQPKKSRRNRSWLTISKRWHLLMVRIYELNSTLGHAVHCHVSAFVWCQLKYSKTKEISGGKKVGS